MPNIAKILKDENDKERGAEKVKKKEKESLNWLSIFYVWNTGLSGLPGMRKLYGWQYFIENWVKIWYTEAITAHTTMQKVV